MCIVCDLQLILFGKLLLLANHSCGLWVDMAAFYLWNFNKVTFLEKKLQKQLQKLWFENQLIFSYREMRGRI